MQFSTVAFLFAAVASAATLTETDTSSTLVTITSCGEEVTDCPAAHNATVAPVSSAANTTAANVSTWEGAANKQYAVGAAALAAGALLAFMKLSDESKAFHHAVYAVVRQVPYGHATSYGHIAYVIGRPQNLRLVGASLKHYLEIIRQLNQDSGEDAINAEDIPWWRVISSSGAISPRGNTEGEVVQKRRLLDEGVEVVGMKVDLDEYGWFEDDVEI